MEKQSIALCFHRKIVQYARGSHLHHPQNDDPRQASDRKDDSEGSQDPHLQGRCFKWRHVQIAHCYSLYFGTRGMSGCVIKMFVPIFDDRIFSYYLDLIIIKHDDRETLRSKHLRGQTRLASKVDNALLNFNLLI